MVIAEVIICGGGSCDVPREWLQTAWREQGIWRSVGLIFSECMGYCEDSVNMRIITREKTYSLSRIQEQCAYDALIEWAKTVHTGKALAELPAALSALESPPFSWK